MSQSVVVKLDGVQSTQAERVELTRSEQMLEVTSWSNRLDKRLQEVIRQTKLLLDDCQRHLKNNDKEQASIRIEELLEKTIPELVELAVVGADHVYFVDRYAHEIQDKLDYFQSAYRELRGEFPVRLIKKIQSLAFRSTNQAENKVEETKKESRDDLSCRELRLDRLEFEKFDHDKLVDNSNTAFELFDNWVTTFHHQGKSYGANNIVYSDLSERIFDLNKVFRIKDKKVLEIGPFEGGNTKQLFDLGAESILAIESNREFYFKTSIVAQEFALDRLRLLHGDCNEILQDQSRFPDNSFDLLYASGVLYHMYEPLQTIRTFSRLAANIYVNTHVASDQVPSGDWVELRDSDGTQYRGRRNTYETSEHWGGVEKSAIWLDKESMYGIFQNLGFTIKVLEESDNPVRGNYVGFLAQKNV